jgi:FAD/FMN-containing dehydrogenase
MNTVEQPVEAPARAAPLNAHHLRFVLRQWIEHKNPANLRLHVWINGIGWLGLVTLLSQIPTPVGMPLLGANVGAWFAALSVAYWLPVDVLVSLAVGAMTVAWASVPSVPWGPGHGWLFGVLLPLLVFTAMGLTALYAHIYHHEHCEFMKGDPPLLAALETTHAVIWGPFHFWLEGLLHAGARPALKAQLDREERQQLLRRPLVPWSNWGRTSACQAKVVCVPQSTHDLVDIVQECGRNGRRIRVVASGFSWSGLVPTEDVLIFCERLDRITVDVSNPSHPVVWAEAGVTNRQLNAELKRHGLTMPWNVVLENVRVAGIVSVGTHGSGQATSTLGDLVEALEVVDSEGRLRVLSEATVGPEVMSAARIGLGLFGVIARVRLRVVPGYSVRQVDRRLPMRETLSRVMELVRQHDSVELYWFAFNSDVWLRTVDRTDATRTFAGHGFWFKTLNFVQNFWLRVASNVVQKLARRLTPMTLRFSFRMLTFQERILELAESQHYRRWIEMIRCGCVEVGFKADADGANVRQAWEAVERLVESYGKRGLYPMNLTLNMRFIGESQALLTPAFGPGLTCYIEALCVDRPEGWDEFSAELCGEWLKIPGALPHWAKEFEHVPGVASVVRDHLGDRRGRFLAALAEAGIDTRGAFANPMLKRVLLDEPSVGRPSAESSSQEVFSASPSADVTQHSA